MGALWVTSLNPLGSRDLAVVSSGGGLDRYLLQGAFTPCPSVGSVCVGSGAGEAC